MQVTIRISVHDLKEFHGGGKVELQSDGIDTILVHLDSNKLGVSAEKVPGVIGLVAKVNLLIL